MNWFPYRYPKDFQTDFWTDFWTDLRTNSKQIYEDIFQKNTGKRFCWKFCRKKMYPEKKFKKFQCKLWRTKQTKLEKMSLKHPIVYIENATVLKPQINWDSTTTKTLNLRLQRICKCTAIAITVALTMAMAILMAIVMYISFWGSPDSISGQS